MESKILSNRKFKLIGFGYDEIIDIDYFYNTPKMEETELLYSIQENFDIIMDLKIHEETCIKGNRDANKTDLIIIKRIS